MWRRSLIISLFASALLLGLSAGAAHADEGAAPAAAFQLYLPVVQRAAAPQTEFERFAAEVKDGSQRVAGVYVEGVLSNAVEQQPHGNAAYVTSAPQKVTEYELASARGVTGLLAHNHLAGRRFASLELGQTVRIVRGDGSVKSYRIAEIRRYQAVEPANPYGDLIDLSTGQQFNALDVFNAVYAGQEHVTFQTCITRQGNPNWGRLFVIALPIP